MDGMRVITLMFVVSQALFKELVAFPFSGATPGRPQLRKYLSQFHRGAERGRLPMATHRPPFRGMMPRSVCAPGLVCDAVTERDVHRALAGTKWHITLDVGREMGTHYTDSRPEWGASGARLPLPVDLEFAEEPAALGSEPYFDLVWHSAEVGKLKPLGVSKFISKKGQQTVLVEPGGWQLTPTGLGEFLLRFCLEFPGGATKNDVRLPAERVYFVVPIWEETQLAKNEVALAALQQKVTVLNEAISRTMGEEANKNPFAYALALPRGMQLMDQRVNVTAHAKDIRNFMPDGRSTIDGPSGFKISKTGGIAVRERARHPFAKDTYPVLGKFTVRSLDVSDGRA